MRASSACSARVLYDPVLTSLGTDWRRVAIALAAFAAIALWQRRALDRRRRGRGPRIAHPGVVRRQAPTGSPLFVGVPHAPRRDDTSSTARARAADFQSLIMTLQQYWAEQGCVDPAALRRRGRRGHVPSGDDAARARSRAVARGLRAAVAPPDRRPLRREPEPPAALLSVPGDPEAVARRTRRSSISTSLRRLGIDPLAHDIRFVEDDWESPTLGAWGLGWEVWCDGMEVSQFTYFQQVGGIDVRSGLRRVTYGLERLAMYVQGVENVYDLAFNGAEAAAHHLRRRVPRERARVLRVQLRAADTSTAVRGISTTPRRSAARCSSSAAAAAGVRRVHQGEPPVQPARRARRDQRDRAAEPTSAACARSRKRCCEALARAHARSGD